MFYRRQRIDHEMHKGPRGISHRKYETLSVKQSSVPAQVEFCATLNFRRARQLRLLLSMFVGRPRQSFWGAEPGHMYPLRKRMDKREKEVQAICQVCGAHEW